MTFISDSYQAAAQAQTNAQNEANSLNENISNANSLATTGSALTDTAAQQDFLNNLQTVLNTMNNQATGSFQTSVTDYQQALDAYNALLQQNNIATIQPNPTQATAPSLPDFLTALAIYNTDMQNYLATAQNIVTQNTASKQQADAQNDACQNCVTPALATLTDLESQINTQLQNQANAVTNLTTATTQADLDSAQESGQTASDQLAILLPQYQTAYQNYFACVDTYNQTNPQEPLPTDQTPFQTAYANATTAMNQNNAALANNYAQAQAVAPINSAYSDAISAFQTYQTAADAQNQAQAYLASVVADFPMASSAKGEPTATDDLEAWKASYIAAVQALQTAIANTDTAGTAYQTALDNYNALSDNPLFPISCNPTTISNYPDNSAVTDYLNALQNPTNPDDLTTGTGAIPDAVNNYLVSQALSAAFNQAMASQDAFYQAVQQLVDIQNDVQATKTDFDNYMAQLRDMLDNLMNGIAEDPSPLLDIPNQRAIFQTGMYKALQDLSDLQYPDLINDTYNQFIEDATAYNTLAAAANQPNLIDTSCATETSNDANDTMVDSLPTAIGNNLNCTLDDSPNFDSNLLSMGIIAGISFYGLIGAFADGAHIEEYIDDETTWRALFQGYFDMGGWGNSESGEDWVNGPVSLFLLQNYQPLDNCYYFTDFSPSVCTQIPPTLDAVSVPTTTDLVPNPPCEPLEPDFTDATTATVPTGVPCTTATSVFTSLPTAPTFTGVTVNSVYPPVATTPSVTIKKTSQSSEAGTENSASTPETAIGLPNGQSTTLYFRIANNGSEPLTNIQMADKTTNGTTDIGNITYQDAIGNPLTISTDGYLHNHDGTLLTLAPGDSITATGTLPPIPQGELHGDVATATGTGTVTGKSASGSDSWYGKTLEVDPPPLPPILHASIDIEKASGAMPSTGAGNNDDPDDNAGPTDADTPDTAVNVPAGEPTQIYYRITNTGNEPLTDVKVSDKTTNGTTDIGNITYQDSSGNLLTIGTDGYLQGADGTLLTLAPGDYITASGTLPPLPPGELHANLATVSGTGTLSGQTVSDADKWHGTTPASPAIDIEKASGLMPNAGVGNNADKPDNIGAGDADTPETAVQIPAGQATQIYYRITNKGNDPLTNITVSDQTTQGTVSVTNITYQDAAGNPLTQGPNGLENQDGTLVVLAPGEYITATATLPPLPPGELHANLATVTATFNGQQVSDSDYWYGQVAEQPLPPTPPIPPVPPISRPSIDIEKASGSLPQAGNGNNQDLPNNIGAGDADTPETAINVPCGQSTTIYYRITNNGDEPLTNIKMTDSLTIGTIPVSNIICTDSSDRPLATGAEGYFLSSSGAPLILAPGDYITATGILPPLPPGELHGNRATTEGTGTVSGQKVSDSDSWHGKTPSVTILETCLCGRCRCCQIVCCGDPIRYSAYKRCGDCTEAPRRSKKRAKGPKKLKCSCSTDCITLKPDTHYEVLLTVFAEKAKSGEHTICAYVGGRRLEPVLVSISDGSGHSQTFNCIFSFVTGRCPESFQLKNGGRCPIKIFRLDIEIKKS